MRKIKFRGMNLCGNWVYGDLRHDRMCMPDGKLQEYISVCGEPIHPKSVGQFTGLKDSTGKEIYEGDVIKTHEGDVGVIVWETELGGFRARLTDDSFYTLTALFASMFSVIGNIYNNSDLLEAHA